MDFRIRSFKYWTDELMSKYQDRLEKVGFKTFIKDDPDYLPINCRKALYVKIYKLSELIKMIDVFGCDVVVDSITNCGECSITIHDDYWD